MAIGGNGLCPSQDDKKKTLRSLGHVVVAEKETERDRERRSIVFLLFWSKSCPRCSNRRGRRRKEEKLPPSEKLNCELYGEKGRLYLYTLFEHNHALSLPPPPDPFAQHLFWQINGEIDRGSIFSPLSAPTTMTQPDATKVLLPSFCSSSFFFRGGDRVTGPSRRKKKKL